jgi:hypothetical protein
MSKDDGQMRRITAGVIAFILWIVTAVVGLVEILVVRRIVERGYMRLWGDSSRGSYWTAVSLGMGATLILALIYIAFLVGTGEYHRSRVGQRSSWKLFGWTVAVELLILLLYFVI